MRLLSLLLKGSSKQQHLLEDLMKEMSNSYVYIEYVKYLLCISQNSLHLRNNNEKNPHKLRMCALQYGKRCQMLTRPMDMFL